MRHHFCIHSRPLIPNADPDSIVFVAALKVQVLSRAFSHSLHGIEHQVDKNLLQLDAITNDHRAIGSEIQGRNDALFFHLCIQQGRAALNHLVHIQPFPFRGVSSDHRSEPPDYIAGSLPSRYDTGRASARFGKVGLRSFEPSKACLSICHDGSQGLAHLVSERRCEFSECAYTRDVREFVLCLAQGFLREPFIRDIDD